MKTADALPARRNAPLARDSDGNPFELPDGAAYWRVRRQTGGRPRKVLGVDRQPLRVPLEMTAEELEDVLGPSSYLLDLHDQAHNSLNVTVPVTVGSGVDAPDDEAREVAEASPAVVALPATTNEVRLVLEANIRAMSASFQHNERQLVTSQRMAETLREGVRVLADAQADWIKSLTSAKGYLRNAGSTTVVAAQPKSDADEDDTTEHEEEEEYVEEEYVEEKHWMDKFGEQLVPVMPMIMAWVGQKLAPSAGPAAPTATSAPSEGEGLMGKIRNVVDWRRAAEIGAAKRAKNAAPEAPTNGAAASEPTLTPTDLMRLTPPDVVARIMRVAQAMTPEDRARLQALLGKLRAKDIPSVAEQIRGVADDRLAAYLLLVAESVEQDDRKRAEASTAAPKE
jgi:hypothetical protein